MKKYILLDILCLLLIVTVIGIPIAIYLLRKSDDYGKSDNVLKPSTEVIEQEYKKEIRKFSPLYTKTTILPVLTEEDIENYKKETKEIIEEPRKKTEAKKETKKNNSSNNKTKKNVKNNNKKINNKKNIKTGSKKPKKKNKGI